MHAGDVALAAVRALHFACVLLLFGQCVYALDVSPDREPGPGFRPIAAWCTAGAFASALAWLLFELPRMSGLPFAHAAQPETLRTLLTETQFGKLELARLALLVAFAALLAARARPASGALIAGLLLVTISGSGHAGAGRGAGGLLHLAVDSLHILAAGAWLGALLPLILVLQRASRDAAATRAAMIATARFSKLGIVCMAVLLFSGVANALYTIRPISTALESDYGRLLALKIVLFVVIVGIAAVNRTILTPRNRLLPLTRNALVEFILGMAIVAMVGMLGLTEPAAHRPGPGHHADETPAAAG
ncbi:MAG TPA: copper homeostasis membrane protein CopD [Burkholderiales bacterium]|jgi:putative copper resistance protein D